ncbi:MAG TPA: sugar ABC transporter permease, partial [Caldilineaceae bacterium]|nr:sugar ABC transporter permease [Caldilineaceae bacterium]
MSELSIERKAGLGAERTKTTSLLQRIFRYRECYLLIAPTVLLLLIFNYYPAASALYHSMFDWNGANLKQFTGLSNFVQMANDKILLESFIHLIQLTVIALVVNLSFPLGAAAMIFHLRNLQWAYFYRVLFVVPLVVPGVVVLMIWRFIYSPNLGLLNQILRAVGLESWVTPWLGSFDLALYALAFIGFPWVAGFATLIYLAGFQGIPLELLDSAAIDGAS